MPPQETVWKGPRAYINLCAMLLQKKLGVKAVRGYPFLLNVDPSSACQLRCPFCPTGSQKGALRGMDLMPLEMFQKVIDELGPYLFRIELFNWGEPLLNKHLVEMIRYAKKRRIWIALSTNLSVQLSDQRVEDLVLSGLDRLIVSLDGVTEERYGRYRVGGDFNLVLGNLRRIARKKQELGVKSLDVVWQFLVFRHNESDIETAKQMAAEMGVQLKLGAPFVSQEEPWIQMTPTLDEFNLYRQTPSAEAQPASPVKARRCDWLYASAAINANGSVSPCCIVPTEKDDFGYLQEGDFARLYNNGHYQAARAFFSQPTSAETGLVCQRCPWPPHQSILTGTPPLIPIGNPRLRRILRGIRARLQ